MGKFLSLLSVENMKLWKRLSTKLMLVILVVLVIGLSGLVKLTQNLTEEMQKKNPSQQTTQSSTDWKKQLEEQNGRLQQQITVMEKSDEQMVKNSLDSTKLQLAKNKYQIENNIPPVTKQGFWERVATFGLNALVALFAIIACSGLVAGEFSDGTMKTMICRPYSRWQILTAKFLAVCGYSLVLMIAGYLTMLGSIAAFMGTGGADTPMLLWLGGNIVKVSGFVGSLITNGLDFLYVLVYLILAFALSAVSRSRALATGLSIFLMFGGSFTTLLALHFSWTKYIFFADTSFSRFTLEGAPFYDVTLGSALVICLVYCIGFFCASYVTFAKRDIS